MIVIYLYFFYYYYYYFWLWLKSPWGVVDPWCHFIRCARIKMPRTNHSLYNNSHHIWTAAAAHLITCTLLWVYICDVIKYGEIRVTCCIWNQALKFHSSIFLLIVFFFQLRRLPIGQRCYHRIFKLAKGGWWSSVVLIVQLIERVLWPALFVLHYRNLAKNVFLTAGVFPKFTNSHQRKNILH